MLMTKECKQTNTKGEKGTGQTLTVLCVDFSFFHLSVLFSQHELSPTHPAFHPSALHAGAYTGYEDALACMYKIWMQQLREMCNWFSWLDFIILAQISRRWGQLLVLLLYFGVAFAALFKINSNLPRLWWCEAREHNVTREGRAVGPVTGVMRAEEASYMVISLLWN